MAREQYLLHAGEDEIHNREKEIKLVTKKDKWKNFWFYHTKHVIVGICIAALIGGGIYSVVTKVEPDYVIAFLTDNSYTPPECVSELEGKIVPYAKDLNGDGQVKVKVETYDLALGAGAANVDPQLQTANMVRLSGDVQTNKSVIFILDSICADYCDLELGVVFEETESDKEPVALKDLPAVQSMKYGVLLEDFSFYIRSFPDVKEEDKEEMDQFVQANKELLEAFIQDPGTAQQAESEVSQ